MARQSPSRLVVCRPLMLAINGASWPKLVPADVRRQNATVSTSELVLMEDQISRAETLALTSFAICVRMIFVGIVNFGKQFEGAVIRVPGPHLRQGPGTDS